MIEVLAEGLQIHVGGIHPPVELFPRLLQHVARGHRHRADTECPARLRGVHGVLVEDHRIVVGEGHRSAPQPPGRARDVFRLRAVHERVHLAGLADVPVLAEATRQVAPRRAKGEHGSAREEVVQRFLLDGVHAEPAGAPVGGDDHFAPPGGAHETEPPLPVSQLARAGADVALHAAVVEAVPVACGMVRLRCHLPSDTPPGRLRGPGAPASLPGRPPRG